MILEFGELLVWFFACLVGVFILHEYMHKLACERQGGKGRIEVWFYQPSEEYPWLKIPSMRCWCEPGTGQDLNWQYIDYAGGIGAGFVSVMLSLPFYWIYPPLFIALFCCGTINLVYGLYEGMFLRKWNFDDYMKCHYFVELGGLIIGILIVKNVIWDWVF